MNLVIKLSRNLSLTKTIFGVIIARRDSSFQIRVLNIERGRRRSRVGIVTIRGNVCTHTILYIPLLFSYLKMRKTSSMGMSYRFSETNRRISSASDSNIVTRLASRSISGHKRPIQVHQHYGLELHLI